jgi:phage repressor protein C with HTH and peptisase S24 domain
MLADTDRLDDELKEKAAEVLGVDADRLFSGMYNPGSNRLTGDALRRLKAFGDGSVPEGIPVVPIMAQAGYSKHYLEPTFTTELEQIQLPNLPYRGDRYRVFEVSGDSMEPTLKEGFHVVCEKVENESWQSTAQFYIYVVVTLDRIMVKRLFRKNEKTYVCISDNEEFYPQFILPMSEIKELWLVKRKIDWEMPPPKRFEINV